MKLLKYWVQNIKSKWAKSSHSFLEDEFEITDFDHTPFIDEALIRG